MSGFWFGGLMRVVQRIFQGSRGGHQGGNSGISGDLV